MRKPDLFLVGAPKCGTTAMAHYLGARPDIYEHGLWKKGPNGYRPKFVTDIQPVLDHAEAFPDDTLSAGAKERMKEAMGKTLRE